MRLFSKYKLRIDLPKGMSSRIDDNKIRFIGTSNNLIELAHEIRKLNLMENGDFIKLDKVDLRVSDEITNFINDKKLIEMPRQALNIFASKILEVVDGYEDSPFDFNDCGYLSPRLDFDIGVELID
ncbi:hypothetical protein [Carboxylicivirga taeanensis]|uniref:hypothetical protein n=1 Tax=Carboxylicivirga taeanensis TaxID=1416875 RepID=UPI003F6E2985